MNTAPQLLPSLQSLAKEIKAVYKDLSHFEALSIAVEVQRNAILRTAFILVPNDGPSTDRDDNN
jgi:hypothetical protein